MLGYDVFGYNAFNNMLELQGVNKIDASSCVLDELKIDDMIIDYNSSKQQWGYNTIFQAKFQGTLEGGDIDNKGMAIEYIAIEKREYDTLEWNRVALIPYKSTRNLYEYIDRYVQSTQEYEYAVLPLTSSIKGEADVKQIVCDFEYMWIADKNNQIKLKCNVKQNDYSTNESMTTVEPLEGSYPIIFENDLNYIKSSVTATIASDELIDNRIINKVHERKIKDNVLKFLRDKKPKIYKTGKGQFLLVKLSNVKEIPMQQLDYAISDISFDITEIGNPNNLDDLEQMGLVNPLGVV